ncbi:490_t:CDS:2, partial [Racocetra fulgida]
MTNYHSIGDVEDGRPIEDDTTFIKPWWRSLLKAIVLIVCIGLLFDIDGIIGDSDLIVATHGAVASELVNCSVIGIDAVDAAIATQICIGTINAFSAGIGGLMMIRLPNGTAEFIDSRETAPKAARADMYKKNHTWSAIGGLAPSIKLSRYGFPVPPELDRRLK